MRNPHILPLELLVLMHQSFTTKTGVNWFWQSLPSFSNFETILKNLGLLKQFKQCDWMLKVWIDTMSKINRRRDKTHTRDL